MHLPGHVLRPPAPGRADMSVCGFICPPSQLLWTLSLPGEPPFPASTILHVTHPDSGLSLWRGYSLKPAATLVLSHIPSCGVTGPLPASETLLWKGQKAEKCRLPAPHLHPVNKIAEVCTALSSPERPPAPEWIGSGQQVAVSKRRELRKVITAISGQSKNMGFLG